MSRGPGSVQRALAEVFELTPNTRFSVDELAQLAFPDTLIEEKHRVSTRRAVRALQASLGVKRFRQGFSPRSKRQRAEHLGWRYEYALYK